MQVPRAYVLCASSIFAATTMTINVRAQAVSVVNPSPSIEVKVAMEKQQVPVGQSPILIMNEKNNSDSDVTLRVASYAYRVHVDGAKGEAPLTEFQRHLRGEWLPGDGPDLRSDEMALTTILPGESGVLKFDLARYYSLGLPGKYTVNIGVREESSGNYIPSNTVTFEIQAPKQ